MSLVMHVSHCCDLGKRMLEGARSVKDLSVICLCSLVLSVLCHNVCPVCFMLHFSE